MGNTSTAASNPTKSKCNHGNGKVRVELLAPCKQETAKPKRVKFAGDKRNHVTFTKRPPMVDIGHVTYDVNKTQIESSITARSNSRTEFDIGSEPSICVDGDTSDKQQNNTKIVDTTTEEKQTIINSSTNLE